MSRRRQESRQSEWNLNGKGSLSVGAGLTPLVAAVVLVLLAGCATPISPAPRVITTGLTPAQADRAEHNLRLFDTVWDRIGRRYYDPRFNGADWNAAAVTFGPKATAASNDTTLYAAINAMLGLLADGHTGALTPARAKDYRTRQRTMTGFRLLRVGQRWAVDEVLPGSPAEAGGVQRGWIVLSRDGQPMGERLNLPSLRDGEVVRWEFLDDRDQPVALALTACRVSTAREEVRRLRGGIVYLRFDEFDWVKMRWLSRQLKLHRDAPGVVIDLRHNPGGTLMALGFMVGEFFDRGFTYAVSVDRWGKRRELKARVLGSAHYHGRVAVLVDQVSGSAAEIFAAAMQEQHRGTIIGRQTGGDVLSARFFALSDGGMLEYSDRDLLTAQGRRLEKNGVAPDITPPLLTLADLRAGRDPDLEAALRILTQP
jgi:carboxyl-terminal processing protease